MSTLSYGKMYYNSILQAEPYFYFSHAQCWITWHQRGYYVDAGIAAFHQDFPKGSNNIILQDYTHSGMQVCFFNGQSWGSILKSNYTNICFDFFVSLYKIQTWQNVEFKTSNILSTLIVSLAASYIIQQSYSMQFPLSLLKRSSSWHTNHCGLPLQHNILLPWEKNTRIRSKNIVHLKSSIYP